jgi:hypothetical protein
LRLAVLKQRRRGHDPARVIRDLAVMLADGGECVSDLGAVRDQEALFGPVASDSTAFRVVDRIASEPSLLDALRAAHARARERFWELHGAPERLTIGIDATLITAHSEKELAAGNYKGGYGFHPLHAYGDETREALGAMLRPGNVGANTAADHKTVLDRRCPMRFDGKVAVVTGGSSGTGLATAQRFVALKGIRSMCFMVGLLRRCVAMQEVLLSRGAELVS